MLRGQYAPLNLSSMTSGSPMSVSSGIAFTHRLAVRQAGPILAGLLLLLFLALLLGYWHARDTILNTTGIRVAQISRVVAMMNAHSLHATERRVEAILRVIEHEGPEGALNALIEEDSGLGRVIDAAFAGDQAWKAITVSVADGFGQYQSVSRTSPRSPTIPLTSSDTGAVSQSTGAVQSVPVLDAGDLRALSSGATRWRLPDHIEKNGSIQMQYIAPLFHERSGLKEPFGLISLTVDMSWLASFVKGMADFEGMLCIILSPDGVYLSSKNTYTRGDLKELARSTGIPSMTLLGERMLAGESGNMVIPWEGESRVAMFMPLTGKELSLAVLIPEKSVFSQLDHLTRRLMVLAAVTLGLAVWSLHTTTRGMLRPLEYLMGMAARLSKGDFTSWENGEDVREQGGRTGRIKKDEPGRLLRAAESLRLALKQRVEDMTLVAATRERILGELTLARDIQEGIRPKEMPRAENLDVAARLHVTQDVCGDMYDVFFQSPSTLCCVLGDVAARGIPASLLMGRVMPLLRETLLSGMPPNLALETVNRTLCVDRKGSGSKGFVSVLAGVLDIRTGHFVWSAAGQAPPVRIHTGTAQELPWSEGIPVGVIPDIRYRSLEVRLETNDVLFFASDGLVMAQSHAGDIYGETRLLTTLSELASNQRVTCDALLKSVYYDVLRRMAPAKPQDDIAMLAVRWKGTSAP